MAARSAGSEDDDRPPQIHSAFLTIDLPPTMLEYKVVPRSRRLGRYPVTLPHGSSHAGRKNATKAKQDAKWHGERCQFAAPRYVASWHETDVLCVPTNVCSWWKSGHAADITAKTDFDPQRTSPLLSGCKMPSKEIDRRLQKLDPSRYERLFAQSTAPERNCT